MDSYLLLTQKLVTYNDFNQEVLKHKNILLEFKSKLDSISPFNIHIEKLLQIGHILHTFYQLYDNKIYNDSILYSFGFNGYLNNIEGLSKNIKTKHIHFSKFIQTKDKSKSKNKSKSTSKTSKNNCYFENAYYPTLIHSKPIKNTYELDSNYIITGPNASGKTTLLKTTLINIILSQQFGCGCYSKANIIPYDYLHCYLNIPDTSGRDSLFQAEARRCKEIINDIIKYKKQSHFCIFDELYSGTNPDEASSSAIAFMEYMVNHSNIKCMLTTHYIKVCKHLSTNEFITNYNMKTINENDKLTYTYTLQEGISEIKGGVKVLTDMNYPSEIIDKTTQYNSFS
jgi:dsDNA-specific endonuclease/ATPase MutS2